MGSGETRTILDSGFAVLAFLQTDVIYDVCRVAMTVGHAGLLLLFCRSGYLSWLRNSLASVGRMAFTNYLSHSLICALLFSGFGFGLYGRLERHELYYVGVRDLDFPIDREPLSGCGSSSLARWSGVGDA